MEIGFAMDPLPPSLGESRRPGRPEREHEAFSFGHLPGFVPGIRLEVREDDGSRAFNSLYERCAAAPVVE